MYYILYLIRFALSIGKSCSINEQGATIFSQLAGKLPIQAIDWGMSPTGNRSMRPIIRLPRQLVDSFKAQNICIVHT